MSPPVILSAPELLKLLDEPRRVDELTPYLKLLPQQLFEPNLLKYFTQLAIRDLQFGISKLNNYIILDNPNELNALSTFLTHLQRALPTHLHTTLKNGIKINKWRRPLQPFLKQCVEYALIHLIQLKDFLIGENYKNHDQLFSKMTTFLKYLSHLINIEHSLKGPHN